MPSINSPIYSCIALWRDHDASACVTLVGKGLTLFHPMAPYGVIMVVVSHGNLYEEFLGDNIIH